MSARAALFAALALCGAAGCGAPRGAAERVLVVGLDGATWSLLEPWIEEGALPNIARLRDAGSWGDLASVTPPLSAPAWTTAVTGVNPGRHGIYNFVLVDTASYGLRMATSRDRKAPAVWEHLGRAGRRVGIVNIPLTSPPDSVNGFMIGGFPHFDTTDVFFPAGLRAEAGRYRFDPYGEQLPRGREVEFLADLHDILDTQLAATLRLMSSREWDLVWVVFLAPDKTQHFFWRYMDPESPGYDPHAPAALRLAIRQTWARLDAAVGDLVAAAGDGTTIVLLSDHGFGPVRREFRLLNWMRREGYIGSDWRHTPILTTVPYGGEIFVNDERFPGAAVADSERAGVIADVSARLAAVAPPGGESILTDIVERDAIYSGPHAASAPDLFFEAVPGWLVARGNLSPTDSLFGAPSYSFSGYHLPDGIIVAAGPGIATGGRVDGAGLIDVAPTLLYLAGAPIPRALEGRVIEALIDPQRLARDPIRFEDVAIERSAEEIEAIQAVPYIR
jgi:predicted AlkP superfamily phosphohydrolase/phosphomutase